MITLFLIVIIYVNNMSVENNGNCGKQWELWKTMGTVENNGNCGKLYTMLYRVKINCIFV